MTVISKELTSQRSFIYRQQTIRMPNEIKAIELRDLTTQARFGFRGKTAVEHLKKLKLLLPDKPNCSKTNKHGETILRLAENSFWVLSSAADKGEKTRKLSEKQLPENQCYPVLCQHSHAWFVLTGAQLPEMMAKLCAVDLREQMFPMNTIAQTMVAEISTVIVHHHYDEQAVFSLLCDNTHAEYLWLTLTDAMAEFVD